MPRIHLPVPAHTPGSAALRRGRVSQWGQLYLLTTTTQHRERVFEDAAAAASASACFDDPRLLKSNRMLAWVLMPDHLHCLFDLGCGEDLAQSVSRLKSASARHANTSLGRIGKLWSPGFHDHALRREDDVLAAARYLIENPVRAGLVDRVEEYPYWNSVWK